MKLLRTVCCVCLGLLFAVSAAPSIAAKTIVPHTLPEIHGKVVKAVRYKDATGDNLVILSHTDSVFSRNAAETLSSKELYAYRFLLKENGSVERVWRVTDYVRECFTDITAEFAHEAFQVTDLDNNGTAEIWMPYYLGCSGDIGPIGMKIIMYEGGKKYAVRGETQALVNKNAHVGGEYALDEAFNSGPDTFVTFAHSALAKHMRR